jgi:hypothetical protein
VSRYVADLNRVSPQEPPPLNDFDDDLNIFTTTEFFDFDMGDPLTSLPPSEFDAPQSSNDASNTIGFQQNDTSHDFLSSTSRIFFAFKILPLTRSPRPPNPFHMAAFFQPPDFPPFTSFSLVSSAHNRAWRLLSRSAGFARRLRRSSVFCRAA